MLWIKAGILSNGTPWSARALISMICCCVVESSPEPPVAPGPGTGPAEYGLGGGLLAYGTAAGWALL